ncbi:MFS transporter permease [Planosporangium flavigriseum]|uniref:Vitamin K-dependent gamma-carboxylase n=1 Tax=Planosporangium flavigriseum TaxID=373681 RepID=A0A8J3LF72_9ACTN|nr:MFS transporter permease [Planosporangium flavigriseum]GIG72293.1 hypothetical protein Pfl04_06970 [Planosporangium flavigriseum]
MAAVTAWLFEPVPRARVARFRTLVYLFVAADLVVFTPWVRHHGQVPADFYRPLLLGRLLHLPTPTPLLVDTVFWLLLVAACAAATGRAPRALGWTVFVLYSEWMVVAMSYGKVDHDRFALLVALAALPTAGPARHRDTTLTQRGGWALRVTQLAAVAVYFLSAWAKLRFGGLDWLTGATLNWALLRRGTALGQLLTEAPGLLVAAQFGILTFELLSPLVFVVPRRWRYLPVGFFYAFHLSVFATVTISFIPQQIALASFLPLERLALPRRSDPRPPLAGGGVADSVGAARQGTRGGAAR